MCSFVNIHIYLNEITVILQMSNITNYGINFNYNITVETKTFQFFFKVKNEIKFH